MSIDACIQNLERLQALSRWRTASSGACSYEFHAIEEGGPLLHSLASHLKARRAYRDELPLSLVPLGTDWQPAAESLIAQWVFGQDVAPGSDEGDAKLGLVRALVQQVAATVREAEAFELGGAGTMLPSVDWRAIAFAEDRKNWLLEFGWSD